MHGVQSTERLRSNRARPASWPKKSEPQRLVFRDIARFAYPIKTIEALGHVTGAGRSTVKCWLNGSHHPPYGVLAHCVGEIMRRLANQSR